MATRRRDIVPGKEKRAIPCPTRSPILSTKTSTSASPSNSRLQPAARPHTPTDVYRHLVKKPSSTHSPATKPLERKTTTSVIPSQTQKATTIQKTTATRSSINPPLRPASSSAKTVASQKPVPDKEKNIRTTVKDAGKNQSMHARPVSAAKKVRTDVKNPASAMNIKKQESQNITTTAIKRRISSASSIPADKKVQQTNAAKVKCNNQEMFLAEIDDQTEEYLQTYNEMGSDAGNNDKDAKIQTADYSIGIETEVAEVTPCTEEAKNEQQELEEYTVLEIPCCYTVESVAYNTDGAKYEAVEEEAERLNNKQEAGGSGNEADEFQETEGGEEVEENKQEHENEAPMQVTVEKNKQESGNVPAKQEIEKEKDQKLENEPPKQEIVVEKQESEKAPPKQVIQEKKQEPQNATPRLQGKKDGSPVSNDVIEETAIKLREQRKNKVLALAMAFETVIALQ